MMKLGAHLAELRKRKGMTQEQLALAVGVSAPAVSKWETDSSCPDIALLCPIARALDTNLDTLLQFEECLPEKERTDRLNELIRTAREEGAEKAENGLKDLLHQYPSDWMLKYHCAAVLDFLTLCHPMEEEEQRIKRTKWKKELLQEVRSAGTYEYQQKALSSLASLALLDDDLEQVEMMLRDLADTTVNTTMLRSRYHLKKKEPQEARKLVQNRLYVLVRQLQMCLILMMDKEITEDPEQVLEICRIYRQTEELFRVGGETSEGLFVEAYHRLGNQEEEIRSVVRLIRDMNRNIQIPREVLFAPTIHLNGEQKAVTPEMKKMLLDGIRREERYPEYCRDPEFRKAEEELRSSLEKSP